MTVRAKFKVDSITRQKHWDAAKGEFQTIDLSPVGGNSPENAAFYAATPSGSIKLSTINKEAGSYFELGGEYYIDFTKAE